MVDGYHKSEWWRTSYVLAALRNMMQTDPSALVTPDDCNPMTPVRERETRGLLMTHDEFHLAVMARRFK